MKDKSIIFIVILLFSWLPIANARYGGHTSKVALASGPDWMTVILALIGIPLSIGFLKAFYRDFKDDLTFNTISEYFILLAGCFAALIVSVVVLIEELL